VNLAFLSRLARSRTRSSALGAPRRFYGPVRLPLAVHHRLVAPGLPDATRMAITRAGGVGISRFSRRKVLHVLRVFDCAGPAVISHSDARRVAFRSIGQRRRPGRLISQLDTEPMHAPVNASTTSSRAPPHDSGPSWVAGPSTLSSFILFFLPAYPGAPNSRSTRCIGRRSSRGHRDARGTGSARCRWMVQARRRT
jgi:hypothetical protein